METKKAYQQPTTTVVKLQHQHHLLAGSELNSVGGNADLNYRGGGSGPARARSFGGDWDDEE